MVMYNVKAESYLVSSDVLSRRVANLGATGCDLVILSVAFREC
jgi:hypothetical protein